MSFSRKHSFRSWIVALTLIVGLLVGTCPLYAQAKAPARPLGQGVIVRVPTILSLPLVNALLDTTSELLDGDNNIYLLQSKVGATVSDLLNLVLKLLPLHLVESAEPNVAVHFNDADLNQSSMSVLNQSSMSVLNGEGGTSYYGTNVDSYYLSQPAVAQIAASTAANRHATGSGMLIADIDNGSDPGNLTLLASYAAGWNAMDGTPDWSCWSDQSTLPLLLSNGLSELNPKSADDSNINQSSMSVLNQSTVSVLNQSSMSVLNQGGVSVVNGNIVAAPGYMEFLQMYSQHPEFGHGTAVLGLAHLIAPQARLMPVKSFTPDGEGDLASILSGIYYAVDSGANVINMSFSTTTDSPQLAAAIAYAWQHGVVLVASAGNNANDTAVYPGAYEHVLNTAAVDGENQLASFSDYGATIQLAAPGVGLVTPFPDNLWAVVSGTSFSAPLVSGEAALMLSRQHDNSVVASTIEDTANATIPGNYGDETGHGLIRIAAALAALDIKP